VVAESKDGHRDEEQMGEVVTISKFEHEAPSRST
jgi:hypothetical protein